MTMNESRMSVGAFFRKYTMVIALVVVVVFFAIATGGGSLKPGSINNLISQNGYVFVLAAGMLLCILTGGNIDLSVGSVVCFAASIGCVMMDKGINMWLAVLAMLLIGLAIGAFQGFWIAKVRVPAFIATLSMQMMTKGLSLVVSGIKPVYFTEAPNYQKIALGDFLGISGFYNAFVLYIIGIVIAWILYSKSLLGRYTQAIGSNEEAARLSGINTTKWKILVYMVSGLFSAFAGLIMTSLLGSAQPQLGAGYESEAIAAAVIGGTSMSGGEGSIIGTVIGAFIISVLTNGLRSMAVSTEWQTVITGVVLASAVFIDLLRKRGRTN